jgi:UDP-glucose:(heptosyl)LPS alpha-1,3-glucosyltransferase
MKIALAHKRLSLDGGTERDFFRVAEGLRNRGHDVHLFCSAYDISAPEGTYAHWIPVLALGRTARVLSFALLAPRMIRTHRCDVVVSFGRMVRQDVLRSGGGSHFVFLQKMKQGEGVCRRLWHQWSLYHRSVLAVERRQYSARGYKKILAVSREVKREIMTAYHVPDEKIAVIYNGVDHERFHPRNRAEAREKTRKKWDIPVEAPLVLFVGNGFQRKGIERLLKIWECGYLNGIFLLVVGEDAQMSRYRSRLEKRAGNRVIFAGSQRNIHEYYGAADLLALPAFQEAFGNVVLEALASGLPVIVSETVGAAELLTGELTEGILASPDNPLDIEKTILSLLQTNRWPRLSEQARKLGEKYSWDNHFRELEGYLMEVAERRRTGNFS